MLYNRATRRYLALPCGRYDCSICAPDNRRRFLKRVYLGLGVAGADGARGYGSTVPRFLTLTSPPGEDLRCSWEQLTGRFQRLRQRVEYAYGVRIEYAGVVEVTKRGVPHLHVIFRGPWVAQAKWSRLAAEVGFGPVVDVRAVRSGGVGVYMGKSLGGYLSKSFGAVYPRHTRRVRFSRQWAPEWVLRPARAATEARGAGSWELVRHGTAEWYGLLAVMAAGKGSQGPPAGGGSGRDPDP